LIMFRGRRKGIFVNLVSNEISRSLSV
jgi:hypothetical protein